MEEKTDSMFRELVPFREPADMTKQVNKAAEKLKELKEIVGAVSTDQTLPIVIEKKTIDDIIDSFKQLDCERIWLHEAVEEETIRSSVHRHKLTAFPRSIEGEIRDALRSARDSNAATIYNLKGQLKTTEESIADLEKQHELLSVSNVTLGPEKSEMRAIHGSFIENLNQTLHTKASMQINLNEVREILRETIIKTNDFHQACIEVKEDMIAEREDTVAEENRLRQEIKSALEKVQDQRKKNVAKQEEVNLMRSKNVAAENDLIRKKDVILHHEASVLRLTDMCQQREEQMEKELEANMKLQNQKEETKKEIEDLVALYSKDKRTLEKNISKLISESQIAQTEYDQLQAQKIRTMNLLDAALLSGRKDKDEAEEMQKSLRVTKDDLLHQTSECTRLKRDNIELENMIEKTLQDHVGTADVLNKQIQIFQTALQAERKERQMLQNHRDEINKDMSDYITEFNKFTSLTTRTMNEGRTKHQALNERGTELQKNFKEAENTIKLKQNGLQNAKAAYINTQTTLKDRVNILKGSIGSLEEDMKTRTDKYDNQMPHFLKLKKRHEEKSKEFEDMKKLIVEVKMKKAKLEATVESKQAKLEDMDGPKSKVEHELQISREEYLQQLKMESDEIKQVEQDIFDSTNKCNAVSMQNERFEKAIEFFESDISFMRNRMQSMRDGTQKIDLTVGEYRDWLELQWRKHMDLDKKYYDQDILLLDDIKKVEEVTADREKKIEYIHGRLEDQLNILSDFIDNAAQLRSNAQL